MTKNRKPCGRPIISGSCAYPRGVGIQRCRWHWLMAQPADVQAAWADKRLFEHQATKDHVARVRPEDWPDGERWCAGCQSFVPLFYCTGSRCKACASRAAHGQRIEKLYGITEKDYAALLAFQNGVCYICHKKPRGIRLAVDHDHKTGEVRGLLCANNENGCNRAIIANLEGAVGGGLAAARRAVEYLTSPPFQQMKDMENMPQRWVLGMGEVIGHVGGTPVVAHPEPPPF